MRMRVVGFIPGQREGLGGYRRHLQLGAIGGHGLLVQAPPLVIVLRPSGRSLVRLAHQAVDLQAMRIDAQHFAEQRDGFVRTALQQQKAQAQRSMAMSYAFEGDCANAAKFEAPVYEMHLAEKNFFDAGEVANELARVCLDAGSLDEAERWYRNGHDAGMREPDLKADRRDLWEFRWEHAQARIAARRGSKSEADRHVAAAKAVLDRGTNPQQMQFFPYLVGYVALYAGDANTAIVELQQANQSDPFILCLLAQAFEKSGDQKQATEYYRKVMASNAHNPTNAFARPLAKKKLEIAKP